jgi:NAD(P)-dependent dehydrogenase (short-subunit alcohol dehydrogenase family)
MMTTTAIIDTALDRSIVLGYGKVGLGIRRRLPGWPADPPRMDGAVVAVTGAASGLGLAASRGFAQLGATVHAVARNAERAGHAAAEVLGAVPGADVRPIACDVSSLRELRALAARLDEGRLDVLVNNAGVMPDERARSADGHELMFATHVLAPFALTALLWEALERSAPARVINVTSGGMYAQGLPADDLESERSAYSAKRLYARTKRELLVITELWAERLRTTGVVVHAMHPGWADTQGLARGLPIFRSAIRPIVRTPEEGADTIVWLGAAPEPLQCTGRLWHDRRTRPTHYRLGASPDGELDRRRLWDHCQSALA